MSIEINYFSIYILFNIFLFICFQPDVGPDDSHLSYLPLAHMFEGVVQVCITGNKCFTLLLLCQLKLPVEILRATIEKNLTYCMTFGLFNSI